MGLFCYGIYGKAERRGHGTSPEKPATADAAQPARSKTPKPKGAPKSDHALTAQINVRLDAKLKAAGDRALAEAGFTPSKAVRILWEKAARGGEDLCELQAFLLDAACDAEEGALRAQRLALIDNIDDAAAQACANYGLRLDWDALPPLSDEDVEDAHYRDYLCEESL